MLKVKIVKISSGLAFIPDNYVVLNKEEANAADELYVMGFNNCEKLLNVPGIVYLSSSDTLEDPCIKLRKLAIERFPVIKEIEKLQIGPAYAPGNREITNAEKILKSPMIVYSMVPNFNWDSDQDPSCKIIRKNSH